MQEQEHAGEQSRMRALTTELLLQQLPMLQRLMSRLVDCRPTGAACQDHVVQVGAHLAASSRAWHKLRGHLQILNVRQGDAYT